MSLISNDHEVVTEGRKNTMEGEIPKASLRDQIPKKLLRKLNDMEVGQLVAELWHVGNSNRQEWLHVQNKLLQEFEEFMAPIYSAPYAWSSTLHLPVSYTICRTFHSRMNSALLSMDPPFTVVARKEANSDRAPLVQEVMRYAFKDWANCYKGVEEPIDSWIWRWVTSGRGIVKYGWEERFSRFMDVVEVSKPGPPQHDVDAEGNPITIPTVRKVEEERERVIPIFQGPSVSPIQVEDLLMIGGDGDVDVADAVIEQQFLTASDLWTFVDRDIFDRDAVEAVIAGGPDNKAADQTGLIKQERSTINREGSLDVTHDLDRYRVLEAYIRKDIDGSGINSDLVVWVAANTRKILRATYLHRISKSGRRPYALIDFHRRTDTSMPIGLVELTYTLAKEIDTQHNMRVDFGLLSTLPFGFYRASSSMQAEQMPLEPGALIPLDNPQSDVYFPNLGNRTAFGFQEEQSLYSFIERMTSVSDLSLGVLGSQGAARTASGARIVANESNTNLDIYLRRLNRGFKKLLRGLFEMIQDRIPPGFEFRLLGDDGQQYFAMIHDRAELAGMYDFELEGSSASSNKQIQVDNAQQLYQVTQNPLDLQLGLITPIERFEAIRAYLQALGIKNWSKFLRKPAASRLYTPEEVANRVLAGQPMQLDPTQDLQGIISYIEYLFEHDDLLGQFTQEQAVALERKRMEAAQLMEAMQAAAAQQANAQQMQMNAAMSQQQTGGGGAPPASTPVPGQPGA
jgi:hypothetical protein